MRSIAAPNNAAVRNAFCPLATVIGGQLLASGGLAPELLAADEAFRRAVFDRFGDERVGRLGADVDQFQDTFSAGHLLALTSRAQAEVALAARLASEQGKRLATMSVTAEFRFESAEQRAGFVEALRKALLDVVARHASPATKPDGSPAPGRPYRLVVGAYPIPPRTSEKP